MHTEQVNTPALLKKTITKTQQGFSSQANYLAKIFAAYQVVRLQTAGEWW